MRGIVWIYRSFLLPFRRWWDGFSVFTDLKRQVSVLRLRGFIPDRQNGLAALRGWSSGFRPRISKAELAFDDPMLYRCCPFLSASFFRVGMGCRAPYADIG